MTQKRRKADSGKAIGETTALRWEPTHVTKPNPRVVPLHSATTTLFLVSPCHSICIFGVSLTCVHFWYMIAQCVISIRSCLSHPYSL